MRSSEVCFVAPDACRNVLGRDTEPQFTRDQRFIGASLAEVKYVMGPRDRVLYCSYFNPRCPVCHHLHHIPKFSLPRH